MQGYRRFRCRNCGRRFNERTGTVLNRIQAPTDIVFLVVFWRLRYKLSLRDPAEMFLIRGIVITHEAVRDWEAKLAPLFSEALRKRRRGKIGRSWHSDETPAFAEAGSTSRSTANGAISTGRSTGRATWSMST